MTKQLTALLIEDDPVQRATVAALLESAGFACKEVGRGADGITAITHTAFDLVIVDWMLPDVSGSQLISTINASPFGYSAKVIVITALDNENEHLAEAFRAGADDVYRKGMGYEILAAKFKSLARKFQAEAKVACRLSTLEERMAAHVKELDDCSAEKEKRIAELEAVMAQIRQSLDVIQDNTKQTAEIVKAWNQAKAFVGFVKAVGTAAAAVRWPIVFVISVFAYVMTGLKTGVWYFHMLDK